MVRTVSLGIAAILFAGCSVGPNYHRPAVTVPATFGELPMPQPSSRSAPAPSPGPCDAVERPHG